MTELAIEHAALRDIEKAAFWYESQRTDLGIEFVLEVDDAMQRIEDMPTAYHEVYLDFRRALTRRFPYAVYFRIEEPTIRVFAVLDQRRSDDFVAFRLSAT